MPLEQSLITLENKDHTPGIWRTDRYLGTWFTELNPFLGIETDVYTEYNIPIPTEITALCQKIADVGGRAFVVGGCIRDIVRAQIEGKIAKPKDYDLEVYGISAETLYTTAALTHDRVHFDDAEFQVLKVKVPSQKQLVDVALARLDNKTDDRHSGFSVQAQPALNIREAANRRDITINALLYDPLDNKLYDPYKGIQALKDKEIKVVNEITFQEVPIRVLRIMQFAARFGYTIDNACINLSKEITKTGKLDREPKERITAEMLKLFFKGETLSTAINFALDTGIVDRYWPMLKNTITKEKLAKLDMIASMTYLNDDETANEKCAALIFALCQHEQHTRSITMQFLTEIEPPNKIIAMVNQLMYVHDQLPSAVVAAVDNNFAPLCELLLKVEKQHISTIVLDAVFASKTGVLLPLLDTALHKIHLRKALLKNQTIMAIIDQPKPGPHIGVLTNALDSAFYNGEVQTTEEAVIFLRQQYQRLQTT